MVQGEREKTHGGDRGRLVSSLIALSKSCVALAYSDPLNARRGSVLLTKKSSEGCPVLLPEERIIKTSILGDL